MIYFGMLFVALVGTFLHFLYEISDHNKFGAVFSAVNESTWEHIKICMTPTLIWCLFDAFVYGTSGNYLVGKALCLLTIIILIPVLFYSYTFFTKKSILVVDIICFYIVVICSNLVFNYIINLNTLPFIYVYLSCIILFIEICAYMFLTFNPIKHFIFEDPISHKYGLKGHTENHHHKH